MISQSRGTLPELSDHSPTPAVNSSSTSPVRILVVQDHPLLASAIARVLDSQDDLSVCGITQRGVEAVNLATKEKPSVVLMDFNLPDLSGPLAAEKIRSAVPHAAIVFHSAEESEDALLDAIDAGAVAYLTKAATADEIIEAVRKASVGEVLIPVGLFAQAIARQRSAKSKQFTREKLLLEFTERELEVLHLLAQSHGTATIARRLGITDNTVAWHVANLIDKLRVHSRLQAVIEAARLGLIDL